MAELYDSLDNKIRVQKVLETFGIDFEDPNFHNTPTRWLKYIEHYCQSFDPKDALAVTFPLEATDDKFEREMVIQTGIPYRAICAHHLVPVLGTAHIGYIPGKRVVGLSKLSRLLYGISHATPSLQEDVGNAVVDALQTHLEPLGAMCVISAEHGCMSARGVEEATGCIDTVTSHVRGCFTDPAVRMEFLALAGIK